MVWTQKAGEKTADDPDAASHQSGLSSAEEAPASIEAFGDGAGSPVAEAPRGLRGGQETMDSWSGFFRGTPTAEVTEEASFPSVPSESKDHEIGDETHLSVPEGLRVHRDAQEPGKTPTLMVPQAQTSAVPATPGDSEEEPPVPSEPSAMAEVPGGGKTQLPRSTSHEWSFADRAATQDLPTVPAGDTTAGPAAGSQAPPSAKAKAEDNKRSSRWWSFAWRRDGRVLDLGKDTGEAAAENSGLPPRARSAPREELTQGLDAGAASPTKEAMDDQVVERSRAERSSKTPSGSAMAAARRGDDSTGGEDGVHESEDFVPELLSPQQGSSRRSRSLFSWRRRRSTEEKDEAKEPGTPRRRSKTPGVMTTLREEQGEAADERRASGATNPGQDQAEAATESGTTRTFLPSWRGTLRSRENSAEGQNGTEGQPRAREGRPKEKDGLVTAFLKRATSRDNSSRHGRGQRSVPVPHAGDSPATDTLAGASPLSVEGNEGFSPGATTEEPSSGKASATLPFSIFRWSGKREVSASCSAPSTSRASPENSATPDFRVEEGELPQEPDSPRSDREAVGEHTEEGEEKEIDEDKLPDDQKAALRWEKYRAQNRSIVGDVFEGQLRSQLRCSCAEGHTSSTFEPFRYLSIPIPSNHMDRFELKVVFFPAMSSPHDRPPPQRLSVLVPKSSTAKRVQLALARQLSIGRSSLLLAEVYRSRIHRYLDPNLPLSDVRSEDQIVAFEVPQSPQDLREYEQRLLPPNSGVEPPEDLSIPSSVQVLMIQAMHRRVVDVCRSDGRTWSQRREVFGLPFVMSAASSWTYATLHEMLVIHATRFLAPLRGSTRAEEQQVPFVARIVNASGTGCGACDRRNCTGCLLPKGNARLRLRAGLFTGAAGTAKIYLALDWVESSRYDQAYVESIKEEKSAEAAGEETDLDTVPLASCINAFAATEEMKAEGGNGVKCDQCKDNVAVDAHKKIDIWREPDVLVLHIKRFHFSGDHFEKISTPVQVPLKDLDIRAFVVGPTGGSYSSYDLYGVACHRGGMSGGHYTSYCMNEGGEEPRWLKFNDDTVSSVDIHQELPEIAKQCYVLFYRKRAFSSSKLINYLSL